MPILGMTMELPKVGWSVLRRGDHALLRSVRLICTITSNTITLNTVYITSQPLRLIQWETDK